MKRNFLAAAALLALLSVVPDLARADPDFFAACRARPDASDANCDCQSKLAKASLTPLELQWAAIGVSQGGDALKAELKSFPKPDRMQFLRKMRRLGAQAKSACQ